MGKCYIKNILVVDDDLDDSTILEQILSDIDPTLHFAVAEDGKEALEMLKNNDAALPDVIFLDLNMPRMDGKECLRRLKADEQLKHISVIIYTTSSQPKDIAETLSEGAICFISKPLDIKEVEAILKTVTGNSPNNLEAALRSLGNQVATYIACKDK